MMLEPVSMSSHNEKWHTHKNIPLKTRKNENFHHKNQWQREKTEKICSLWTTYRSDEIIWKRNKKKSIKFDTHVANSTSSFVLIARRHVEQWFICKQHLFGLRVQMWTKKRWKNKVAKRNRIQLEPNADLIGTQTMACCPTRFIMGKQIWIQHSTTEKKQSHINAKVSAKQQIT